MRVEAKFYKPQNENVQCFLCNHKCIIKPDNVGICGVRKNEKEKLYSLIYSSCSSVAIDPIEKKPLFHFYPGSNVLSLGSVGCNFKCENCQNYGISTANNNDYLLEEKKPEEIIEIAKNSNCRGIAWTYNEPTIWHEYTYDCAKLAKQNGLYTVYVTNGYITKKPLEEISNYLDAMNIDVKAFNQDFYKKICKAKLKPVLETCKMAKDLDIHIELTYLVIPGLNDSKSEIENYCNWVANNLGNNTPLHFSRFHPQYKMNKFSPTPINTLEEIYKISKSIGINFVYLGNIPNFEYENTICPNCGNLIIKRQGFSSDNIGLKNNKCDKCGQFISIITD